MTPKIREAIRGFCCLAAVGFIIGANALFPNPASAVTVPQWQSLPLACLPGRAAKWVDGKAEDQQAACHCPPSTLCPSTAVSNMQEFLDSSKMPPGFTTACCAVPTCPTGTALAGKPLPVNGDCNNPPCQAGFTYDSYNGSYQHFEYGAMTGPSVGSVSFQGCVPICTHGDPLFAEDGGPFGSSLGAIWIDEGVPNTATKASDGKDVYIACRGIAQINDCLSTDSQITLSNGRVKPIGAAKPGDLLTGPDGDAEVIAINHLTERGVFYRINHLRFAITGNHPLKTTRGWKSVDYARKYPGVVGRLEIGDQLVTRNAPLTVTAIQEESAAGPQGAINIKTAGDRPFFVDGVIVKPFNAIVFTYK